MSVSLSGEDSVIAAQVGSPGGVLQGAIVSAQRNGSGSANVVNTTGPNGQVRFDGLVPGTYTVSVARVLTAAEVVSLGAANADVNALGGGATLNISGAVDTLVVRALAGRRGSLVISEIFNAAPTDLVAKSQYIWGEFIELYNNSDTTIYLDGKMIGRGYDRTRNLPSPQTCNETSTWRNDPNGIWARFFDAFPGSGHDHPIAAGATVVVATDAIDHSSASAGMLDLSHADFEFHGSNDVDNPTVPNMVNVGLAELPLPFYGGHGATFVLNESYFVSDSVDVGSLVRDNPASGLAYVRIPASKVLDVFTTSLTPAGEATENANGFPLCAQIVNQNFDRQYAAILDPTTQLIQSMRRKVFATLPDGRVILLRTKSSANDFEVAQPTPGTVGK